MGQESVYCRLPAPESVESTVVKHDLPTPIVRRFSAPPILLSCPFRLKRFGAEQAHRGGECRPCAYFFYKDDGCRWGEDCQFCHLCRPGEMKRRKRARAKALKAQAKATAGCTSGVNSVREDMQDN